MKCESVTIVMIFFIMTGCFDNRQVDNIFITIDITKSYPKKELILQDILDVEYVPLETNDEFVTQGFVQAIGKNIILVRNRNNDGNIFFFDRKGNSIMKINKQGNGSEEYTSVSEIAIDEDNNEMFINDPVARKVLVYDLQGSFKRYFRHIDGTTYNGIYIFDDANLICNDSFHDKDGKANEQSFIIISRLDGHITESLHIPFKSKKTTWLVVQDAENEMIYSTYPRNGFPIIPHQGNFIITEFSSDTIFKLLPDKEMVPIVVRTPSIQSMDPEVFLFPSVSTDRYFFMLSVKKIYDFEKNTGFPRTDLLYDNQEKSLFEYSIYNCDFLEKKSIDMSSKFACEEIAFWGILHPHDLVEAYQKGQLKGELKEIAATLDEESNPVIMLAKYKK